MAIVADVDVFIMGSMGAGLAAAARLIDLGHTVAIGDEQPHPGGLLTGGLGLPDYVGISDANDTLTGFGRKFFQDCEVAAIADGAVEGSPEEGDTPAVKGYGRYHGLPRRYLPEWGRYARDIMLEGTQKFWDIEIAKFDIDPVTKLGGIVTLTDGREIKAKQFLSASYEAQLGHAAHISYSGGRSENQDTYNEELAGAVSNGSSEGNGGFDLVHIDAKGNLFNEFQGKQIIPARMADLGVMAYNYRMTLSQHPLRLPFQPPARPGGGAFREADFESWIVSNGSKMTGLRSITSGQWTDEYNITTNGGSQYGLPREYLRCKNKRERRDFWDLHYYNMAGWYYLAQNSSRMKPEMLADSALWGLPHNHNVTEYFGQQGWSAHLYIRECFRMNNGNKMTFHDMGAAVRWTVKEPMGRGGYHCDSHIVAQTVIPGRKYLKDGGMEDAVQGGRSYYQIPFAALKPPRGIIRNMLEIGCPAVTRTVMCSLRMEPTWMSIGEAAALAVHFALLDNVPVTEVEYQKIADLATSLEMKI